MGKALNLKAEDAVVDPPDGAFTVAFRLAADDVALRGFTIQGASVGVDTSDRFSGYRVDHGSQALMPWRSGGGCTS